MGILNWYVLRGFLLAFFMAIGILTFAMTGANLIKVLDLVAEGASAWAFMQFVFYILPIVLTFTIPWAVMVAVSIALNKIFYPTPYQFGRITEYVVLALALFFVSERLPIANEILQYSFSTLLILIYLGYAVWREKIDVVAMAKHFLRRGKR